MSQLHSSHDSLCSFSSRDTLDTRHHHSTCMHHGNDHSTDEPTPPLDLHRIYAAARSRKSSKARSLSSFTTEWSTATAQTSNTTTKKETKKNKKRRFIVFTKVLMKLLEKKDPDVFQDAQAVIHDCEEKKKNGETESVVESLKSPLKEAVGPEYWNEARRYSSKVLKTKTTTTTTTAAAPAAMTDEDDDMSFSTSDLTFVHDALNNGYSSPVTASPLSEEEQIRKKRKWMIICVFMKYLMRKDSTLYLRAKDLVSDCVRQHRSGDEAHRSLSGSIQTCLKKEIGAHHWRRAESMVAKIILLSKEQAEESMSLEPLPYYSPPTATSSSFRKRMDDPNSLKSGKKRQRFYEV